MGGALPSPNKPAPLLPECFEVILIRPPYVLSPNQSDHVPCDLFVVVLRTGSPYERWISLSGDTPLLSANAMGSGDAVGRTSDIGTARSVRADLCDLDSELRRGNSDGRREVGVDPKDEVLPRAERGCSSISAKRQPLSRDRQRLYHGRLDHPVAAVGRFDRPRQRHTERRMMRRMRAMRGPTIAPTSCGVVIPELCAAAADGA